MRVRITIMLLAAALAALAAAPMAGARTVPRAIVDTELLAATPAQRAALMREYAVQLRATMLRVVVSWSKAEPARGTYDEAYLAAVSQVADLAKARGVKLVLTVVYTPEWASDQSLWQSPPGSPYVAGRYYPFYAPEPGAIDELGVFAEQLAGRLAGKVFAYECWNEPNLWPYLYPQTLGADRDFAVRRYVQMLKAFYRGVKTSDARAVVIGGATAPIGDNDKRRTSPIRFARMLKSMGGSAYFDAYSHHPYAVGGSRDSSPEAAPTDPLTTVQLSNLGALLTLFPSRAFYLTEFGYNTSFSTMFGGVPVDQARQASYLRRAYRYAGRYAQVRSLFWYLRKDWSPSGRSTDTDGVYTGLRTVTSSRKRSWFAFAGGTHLTLTAPAEVRPGRTALLTGTLTSRRLVTATSNGGLPAKTLAVQRRTVDGWRSVAKATTGQRGGYRVALTIRRSGRYRVVWTGVVASATRSIAVR